MPEPRVIPDQTAPLRTINVDGVEYVSRAFCRDVLTERDGLAEALEEIRDELDNFADYSRAVAADAAGQARLTWQERAAWAQGLVATASVALDEYSTKENTDG